VPCGGVLGVTRISSPGTTGLQDYVNPVPGSRPEGTRYDLIVAYFPFLSRGKIVACAKARPRQPVFLTTGMRSNLLECGDSAPLSLAATRCGEPQCADQSAVEKAATSRRNPKFGSVHPHKWQDKPAASMADLSFGTRGGVDRTLPRAPGPSPRKRVRWNPSRGV
jgi:hypothetical protein